MHPNPALRLRAPLLVAALLAGGSPLQAQVATYQFTGKVQATMEPGGTFQSPVSPYAGLNAQVGDRVTGTFSYDTVPGTDLYPTLTNIAGYHDGRASIEINLNGHLLTSHRSYVEVADDVAEYAGVDQFVSLSLNGWILDNGRRVPAEGEAPVFSVIRFVDDTHTALTNTKPPASLALSAFNLAFGRVFAGGTNNHGIEFSLDSIERIYELRTGRFVAWPTDAPGTLEVSDQVGGPYTAYGGKVFSFPGEHVVEMDLDNPATFYRLVPSLTNSLTLDNFDQQPPGTAPDVGAPVGEWQFPANYVSSGVAEPQPALFSVVATSDFDPGGTGNSLRVQAGSLVNVHLPALLSRAIDEATTTQVLVRFEVFVPTSTGGGCAVYLGGDHGGGGFDSLLDRGPQVVFSSGNNLVGYEPTGPRTLGPYARDAWQTVALEIDLKTDRYAVSIGPRGGPLTALATEVQFRSGSIRFIDRVTVAAFTLESSWLAYVDNVSVTPQP